MQKHKLGKRIRRARRYLRLTQGDLAKVIGVSQVDISRYENDVIQPSLENVIKLARAFRMTIDCLVFNDF